MPELRFACSSLHLLSLRLSNMKFTKMHGAGNDYVYVDAFAEKLPADFYVNKPLTYQKTKDGFVLYAVGPNGIDEKGFGPYYRSADGDDIAIRRPRPVEEK